MTVEPPTRDGQATLNTRIRGSHPRAVAWDPELGDERFELLRRLGEGGMGRVYEAFDRQRKAPVALKTLNRLEPDSLYLLKHEFRALADLVHPNIVRLHELFGDGPHWFFTMELAHGLRFDSWVAARDASALGIAAHDDMRLRSAFAQLCEGIGAIHAAGKLHRDLKPSNVVVTPNGRVIVLDFGLAVDRARAKDVLGEGVIAGTPHYMAPEQAAGASASPASDCYALGVMLYEALTGDLPFSGSAYDVMVRKQLRAAPALRHTSLASDLAELCDLLLNRDPNVRATLDDCRYVLRAVRANVPPSQRTIFVGRDVELAGLRRAYEGMRHGQPTVAFVTGESGAGKTTLCRAFLDGLPERGRSVGLRGRCYEGENVPYTGVDSLVDDATRFLSGLPQRELAAIMPVPLTALARVFPVLGRIESIATAKWSSKVDPVEGRHRAFAELAALVAALARRSPLVCWIDDAQWLDADAILLLEHLVSSIGAASLLLLFSHRSETGTALGIARLRATVLKQRAWNVLDVAVASLAEADARALAQQLLDRPHRALAVEVAAEAEGNPFLLHALARYTNRFDATRAASLKNALAAQVDALDRASKRLLECVAISGRPLPLAAALEASGASHVSSDLLRSDHLLRVEEHGPELTVECYHDKIRDTVTRALRPGRAMARHGSLLAVLERWPGVDPQVLVLHARGAGNLAATAKYAVLTAKRASAALAFDQAASAYAEALRAGSFQPEAARELRIQLADSLAHAGRGREAAGALVEAASAAPRELALELRARAGGLLMVSGQVEEGRALLGGVLRALGLRLPETPGTAKLAIFNERVQLHVRRSAFGARHESAEPKRLRELDILWSTVRGLQSTDFLGAAWLTTRYMRLALESGNREHGALALACEALGLAMGGDPALEARHDALLARAEALAFESGAAKTIAMIDFIRGMAAYHYGDQRRCRTLCERAIGKLRDASAIAPEEVSRARVMSLLAAGELGDFASPREVAALIDDAWRRGDTANAIQYTGLTVIIRLIQGADDDLQRDIAKARERWPGTSYFTWLDWFLLVAESYRDVYLGQSRCALDRLVEHWPAIERAGFMHTSTCSALYFYRGAAALAAARENAVDAPRLLAIAYRSARKLRSSPAAFARAYGQTLSAWIDHELEHTEAAITKFRGALRAFEASGMLVYALILRAKLAALVGGEEGAALAAEVARAARAMRITDLDGATRLVMMGLA